MVPFGIRAISPQSPGVGNHSHDVAANTVYPMDNKIAAPAILSKVPTCILFCQLTLELTCGSEAYAPATSISSRQVQRFVRGYYCDELYTDLEDS